jgi:hypothetical protein
MTDKFEYLTSPNIDDEISELERRLKDAKARKRASDGAPNTLSGRVMTSHGNNDSECLLKHTADNVRSDELF